MSLGIHFRIVFQNSFFQYFQQSVGARKMCSHNIEKNLILFVFLILLGVFIVIKV